MEESSNLVCHFSQRLACSCELFRRIARRRRQPLGPCSSYDICVGIDSIRWYKAYIAGEAIACAGRSIRRLTPRWEKDFFPLHLEINRSGVDTSTGHGCIGAIHPRGEPTVNVVSTLGRLIKEILRDRIYRIYIDKKILVMAGAPCGSSFTHSGFGKNILAKVNSFIFFTNACRGCCDTDNRSQTSPPPNDGGGVAFPQ